MRIVKPYFQIEDEIDGPAILRRIERAGRTCYKSENKITPDSAPEFVRRILSRGHESVIEHETGSVRIICDRGVSHELVRHRIASYSQESTRYCTYGAGKRAGEVTFIRPPWLIDDEAGRVWLGAMEYTEHAYLDLLRLGWTAQQARSVLPHALKTELVMTANLREWRHFFRLRTSPAAHPQMREIAIPMLREFKRIIPVVFDDIECSAALRAAAETKGK